MSAPLPALPIDPLLPAIQQALAERATLVLEAPPGAGKTTRVPLALLDAPWLAGQTILLLEPRRLATRAAAARMAQTLGEKPGERVGYRIRLESRIGPRTRIEVITEGILARRLQDDPGLDGVGLVIFDEFHERSLDADLGLALCLDAQKALRPELRLMAMSATLDGAAVAKLLDDAPVLRSEGRAFPVETRYLDAPPTNSGPNRFPMAMAQAIRKALTETEGDLLAFLPGEREIHAVSRQLGGEAAHGVFVLPLYGALPQADQDRVFAPTPASRRKVVLSTSIAETSLTIDGIRVVVDGGLARVPRYDPASGLTRLETVKVSQASAEQRRGRGGRTAPGICYRLWPEPATRGLLPRNLPEMLQADLTPLALDLAVWGVRDPNGLAWLDAPPAGAFAQARGLLTQLGALDADGGVTAHGKAMAKLPLHPRLAHMTLLAKARGLGPEAAALAALLGERDPLSGPGAMRDADLRHRVELIGEARASAPPAGTEVREATRRRIRETAKQVRRLIDVQDHPLDSAMTGALTALAYPDRLGQRRANGGFRLANGRGAATMPEDSLSREGWLAVAAVGDGVGASADGRIFLAAPIDRDEIEEEFADLIEAQEIVAWDARTEAVQARRQRRLGALLLDDAIWGKAPPEKVAAALLDGIRQMGLAALPWTDGVRQLQTRLAFVRSADPQGDWPDLSDATLLASLGDWLAPHLDGLKSRADLARLNLTEILGAAFDWAARKKLDDWAPTQVAVPSGRNAALDYAQGETPVLAVKLQELFGMADTPRVANGRVPVVIHLLSPAGRPVQVTRDLANFWREGYAAVKKDLKGRYPRHPWPDDPMSAPATARAKPRGT
ncbi:MAG TPA: ATP-dependent helicase HrpB [Alphaproteobacteria bacterium]